ncbi:MAG TPA: DUF2071 domain-containing protein [Bryobacteraceae bacterium]|nr:DUF2071 domain-containing protein [Bryobacteraceae bacterium]
MQNDVSEYPPHPVKRPLMFQGWDWLTFLHWRYAPEVVRPLIPRELELDTFDGAAWIALTPFIVTALRPPALPALPWISEFPEMNVRTYVRGPDGERGIWFYTLEADRLAAVAGARLSFGLPYRWANMQLRCDAQQVEYTSRRHFSTARAHAIVRRGSRIQSNEHERFLTARFRLYTRLAGKLAFAQVEHPPWALESATLVDLNQNVIQHSNLPAPSGNPLVHFSRSIRVRIGRPTFL